MGGGRLPPVRGEEEAAAGARAGGGGRQGSAQKGRHEGPGRAARSGWLGRVHVPRAAQVGRQGATHVVRSQTGDGSGSEENLLFDATRTYLSSRLDPRAMRRLGLTLCKSRDDTGRRGWRKRLFIEPEESTVDVINGAQFMWTSVEKSNGSKGDKNDGETGTGGDREFVLMLSFDEEHTDLAMERYVPFVMAAAEETRQIPRHVRSTPV